MLKGIIWLLIATVAGVPAMASSVSFPVYLCSHRYMNDQVFIFLNLNGTVTLFPPVSLRATELNAILRISSVQRRTFLCTTSWGRHGIDIVVFLQPRCFCSLR